MIIAQMMAGTSIASMAIWLIVICIVCGIVLIVLRASGVNLPQWFWAIVGLLALGVVAIFAIRFLASM